MKRKQELDYMNAIACLLVILIHVLSVGIVEADPASWQAAMIYLPWRFAAFVVPMFLYTAAVKLARQYGGAELSPGLYLRYVLHRLRKIYVPYVLWVLVYYAYYIRRGYVAGNLQELLSYIWTGKLASPFYFVIVIMQFYLTMPLWVWLLRRVPPAVGLGVGLFVTLCMFQAAAFASHFGVTLQYTDRSCLTYSVFWIAGLYAGKYYEQILPVLRDRWTWILSGGSVAAYCLLFYLQYAGNIPLYGTSGIKTAADLLSILLIHAIGLRLAERGGLVTGLLQRVYRYSFPVYLCHCLFLTALEAHLPRLGITKLSIVLPVRAIACYTLPFLLCWILSGLRRLLPTGKRQ